MGVNGGQLVVLTILPQSVSRLSKQNVVTLISLALFD
jgi:hypothetical protein